MTAGTQTASSCTTTCLLCDASMGVSTRKCCPIFKQRLSSSSRTVVALISGIIGKDLKEGEVHSDVICKKCFKTCNEVDDLQERLNELRLEVTNKYQKTMKTMSIRSDSISNATHGDTLIEATNEHQQKRRRGRPLKKSSDVAQHKKNGNASVVSVVLFKNKKDSSVNEPSQEITEPADSDEFEKINDTLTKSTNNDEKVKTDIIEINEDTIGNETDKKFDSIDVKEEEMETENTSKGKRKNSEDDVSHHDDNDNDGDNDDDEDYDDEEGKRKNKKVSKTKKYVKKVKKSKEVLIPQMVVSRDKNEYTCLMCDVENKFVSDARGIIPHVKDQHNLRLYICDMCGLEFFKRCELSKHMDDHITNEDDTFECDVCQRTFDNFRLYRVHKKMHNSSQKNYTCELCGKRFGSRNLLEEHNNLHTGERPYCCSVCGKSFTSKYTLKSHERTHENRPRPYSCINCGKSFLTQQNLIHHERIHSGIKNYICQECGKSFNTARNLETHCVIHTGFKPFICRLCGKAFSRKAEFRDHERTHTGEKPYRCEFCGASFGQRSNLQSHKRTTHYDDKRYKCTDCGRAFKRRRLLDYHMKAAHTGERPYKCVVCLATFIYPEHFKKHKLIHTGEKPYECEVCGKAFNSRDNRNAHRFVHSDKKPYECLVCGLGFMRKPLLYNHMNQAGHQNDTIVVNQPRLTTDEGTTNKVTTTTAATSASAIQPRLEMTLITDEDGNQKLVQTNSLSQDVSGEQKLYIQGLKEHDILIPGEQNGDQQHNLHIVMDGQVEVQYASQHDLDAMNQVQSTNAVVSEGIQIASDGNTIVVPHRQSGTITYSSEPTTMKTDSGSFQIVQIHLHEDSDEQKQWIDLLQAQQRN